MPALPRSTQVGFTPADPLSDRDFVRLLCALRLLLPDAGISLSTREAPDFRDGLRTQHVCDAVLQSAREQKWITVPKG